MSKFSLWLHRAGARMSAGLRSFMSGRYGSDRLNMAILCAGLIASIFSSLFRNLTVRMIRSDTARIEIKQSQSESNRLDWGVKDGNLFVKLKPGMNVSATILVEERENVLLVPIAALNTSRGESYAWLKSDSAADGEPGVRTTVETGLSDENYAEVLSGLSEGDVVLITREATTSTTDSRENGMGGMMMDMGGGMPGGSFDGGMPSGGGAPAGGGRTRDN